MPEGETGVTLFAAEGPADSSSTSWPGRRRQLCASLGEGTGRHWLAYGDALLVFGPEHGRIFRDAGWDRARVQQGAAIRPAG